MSKKRVNEAASARTAKPHGKSLETYAIKLRHAGYERE